MNLAREAHVYMCRNGRNSSEWKHFLWNYDKRRLSQGSGTSRGLSNRRLRSVLRKLCRRSCRCTSPFYHVTTLLFSRLLSSQPKHYCYQPLWNTATGDGDFMMRFSPAFAAVNLMRLCVGCAATLRTSTKTNLTYRCSGVDPTSACSQALAPIARYYPHVQVRSTRFHTS